jgi:hypothetical protein
VFALPERTTRAAPSQELEAFCSTCPLPETVRSLLEGLGFQLTFQMDAVRYPVWSSTPDLPAQFHFSDEHGTDVVFLAGKDTPTDGERFPPHTSRFWISAGADPTAYQRAAQVLASRWLLTWHCPQAEQDLQRSA